MSTENFKAAERLHSAALRLLRLVRVADRATGIAPAQLSALSVLVFAGPQPLHKLAQAEQVTAPTMSRLIVALERKGLVRRVQSREDRRVWSLESTPKGQKLLLKGRDKRVESLVKLIQKTKSIEAIDIVQAAAIMETILYGKPRS